MTMIIFNYCASDLMIELAISKIRTGESSAEGVATKLLPDYPDIVCVWALPDSQHPSGDYVSLC